MQRAVSSEVVGHTGASDLEAEVRTVAAEMEIRNLIARLAHLADADDVDAYVECFTPDGCWEHPSAPRRGHDDIRSGRLERRAGGSVGPGSGTRHVVTTVEVRLDGERARARSTWLYLTNTATAPSIALTGGYDDEFTRTAEGWRLAVRNITIDAQTIDAQTIAQQEFA